MKVVLKRMFSYERYFEINDILKELNKEHERLKNESFRLRSLNNDVVWDLKVIKE
jgi:hypothetical protein